MGRGPGGAVRRLARPAPASAAGPRRGAHRACSAGRLRVAARRDLGPAELRDRLSAPAATRDRALPYSLRAPPPPAAGGTRPRRGPGPRARPPSGAWSRRPGLRRGSRSSSTPTRTPCPPAARIASSASSRLKPSMVPVTTTVFPARGPAVRPRRRVPAAARDARAPRRRARGRRGRPRSPRRRDTGRCSRPRSARSPGTSAKRSGSAARSSRETRASQPSSPAIGSSSAGRPGRRDPPREVDRRLLARPGGSRGR